MPTLHDGRQVASDSEDWRHECEARFILSLPTLAARRRLLYGVKESQLKHGKWVMVQVYRGILQVRGEAEVKRLEATMLALWKAGQMKPANDNGQ